MVVNSEVEARAAEASVKASAAERAANEGEGRKGRRGSEDASERKVRREWRKDMDSDVAQRGDCNGRAHGSRDADGTKAMSVRLLPGSCSCGLGCG